ncbi:MULTISPECIES: ABC transporter ATP-binding protein [unclassified Nocardioides]|uniref:ABC transporter ATP-binding protein n=1 Tax=unclassified Nocardioides TaxID=2615069 RepID=UPI0006FC791B|nr:MULTISPECIES: ABC transporter ATP-binding protein [unclassified Nocardioides]KRA38483.1 ABC transporter [Nocardioides sp. Root614]KRA92443.1 ABC transporter [Nocardioides sp. Root682]
MSTPSNPAAPALAVHDLTRTYGTGDATIAALGGIDLAFRRGTFTAVMGPSGSGKSTLLACAAGLDRPTSGRIAIGGEDVTDWDEERRTRLRRERIGFVFQAFHLMPYLSVTQNVGLPARLAGKRPDRARVRDLIARVGLADRAHHLPGSLSGGQQQRVAIARALVCQPDVVLADEPTGALDSATARQILDLLRSSVTDPQGPSQTVVMVTHDPVAASYADEVVFLVDGRVAGRMTHPTADAVAGQMAHLDDLVVAR